jgi:hypothetical protein
VALGVESRSKDKEVSLVLRHEALVWAVEICHPIKAFSFHENLSAVPISSAKVNFRILFSILPRPSACSVIPVWTLVNARSR